MLETQEKIDTFLIRIIPKIPPNKRDFVQNDRGFGKSNPHPDNHNHIRPAVFELQPCAPPKISNTTLAAHADQTSRRKLALFQVPLLLGIGEKDTALTKETESGETDLVYLVLFHTWQKVGNFVLIGGRMRLDIEESPVDSIYVVVWASHHLPLYMENRRKQCNTHAWMDGTFNTIKVGRRRLLSVGSEL
ncbi:unnamed protein product [Lactuca saligna]|uniref:Uncharacterized protein n=1 Tax=Lactuca saligna TaxID=75948 RepID=A0AA35YKQ2_LACSI|nr:unnamed protein product [Lactuca saligna]